MAADRSAMDVSVVVPVYQNAGTLRELHRRIAKVLDDRDLRFEIIFVDDGSKDGSWDALKALAKEDARVRPLRFVRNFGQAAALSAGFERVQGRVAVTIDADLQNLPEDIPALLDEIDRGYEFVSGYRTEREDHYLFRVLPSRLLNRLVQATIGIPLRDYGCGLNALSRRLALEVRHHGEMRRFLKPLVVMLAESVSEVPVRQGGSGDRSRYSFSSLVGLQLDFFTGFSRKTFQRIGLFGVLMALAGFLGGLVYVAILFGFGHPLGGRFQALIILAMVLGLQLVVLGLLGEFIVRIYHLTQGQPFYLLREKDEREALRDDDGP
ncbi:MAG: glycosyltransferase family 2 protein [Deltaproteobacteria bacterium]|nr:glycosyltransferase family 2 protein [Deltaproteobacteria bacterium]